MCNNVLHRVLLLCVCTAARWCVPYPISAHYYYFCLRAGESHGPDGTFHTRSSCVSLQRLHLCKVPGWARTWAVESVSSLGEMLLILPIRRIPPVLEPPILKPPNKLRPEPSSLILVHILKNLF